VLENQLQPSLHSMLQRMSHELSAKAVLLLHENGQVLSRSGWMEEFDIPVMAALVAAMAAASRPLSQLGDNEDAESLVRIHCESERTGLYILPLENGLWLATLYDQPLNPGQFRMKVRRYAEALKKMSPASAPILEAEEEFSPPAPRANLTPLGSDNSALFENITDEEIDNLFAGSEH
jgi:predicted regulator of Ras-like GTPase activity (Roadblock/LC7/MglB family)